MFGFLLATLILFGIFVCADEDFILNIRDWIREKSGLD